MPTQNQARRAQELVRLYRTYPPDVIIRELAGEARVRNETAFRALREGVAAVAHLLEARDREREVSPSDTALETRASDFVGFYQTTSGAPREDVVQTLANETWVRRETARLALEQGNEAVTRLLEASAHLTSPGTVGSLVARLRRDPDQGPSPEEREAALLNSLGWADNTADTPVVGYTAMQGPGSIPEGSLLVLATGETYTLRNGDWVAWSAPEEPSGPRSSVWDHIEDED